MSNLPIKSKTLKEKIVSFFKTLFNKGTIRENIQTENLNDFKSFFDATKAIQTEKGFYEYIEKIKSGKIASRSILSNIPTDSELLGNKTIVLEALKLCGLDLEFVNEDLKKDSEILLTAIHQNPLSIQYIENKTIDIIKEAVSRNYFALQYVDDNFKCDSENYVFLCEILEKNGMALKFLPNFHNNIEAVKLATNNDPWAIEFVGKDIPDEMIISSVSEIQKEILRNSLSKIKECKYTHEFLPFYININNSLRSTVSAIKSLNPQRFENVDFCTKLCNINPFLYKLAEPCVMEDLTFKEKVVQYEDKSIKEPYKLFKEEKDRNDD